MTPHRHAFVLIDKIKMRYRCECGVFGFRRGTRLEPLTCSFKIGGTVRCGGEAVVANGERNRSRCADHASAQVEQAA